MKKVLKALLYMSALLGVTLSAQNTSFTSAHFTGSGACVRCHNGLNDNQGTDVSIETDWGSSMMANATKDPLWKAKVKTEINRNPQLESVINDKCTKCHAPMANTEAHALGDSVKIFDDGFLNASNEHHDEAMNGVSCTLCHQVSDNGKLGSLDGMSGKYEINENRIIYGPYNNVATGPMLNNVNYEIQHATHIKDSKMCASCHNLKTPYVDENANILSTTPESEFPEQMPYSEWEHSSYKDTQSCQDCHMQRTDGVVMASRPPWVDTQRDGFARHVFVGANKTMLGILNDNKTALGVNSTNFESTLQKTDAMLKSAASIEILNQTLANGNLEVSFKVKSTTGHKLPTSFPSRRAFLHVKITDTLGSIVFESGKVNANGSIVGADSDINNNTFEPHYDVITSQDQVQIYETIMRDNLNSVTYTLLRAMDYKKDNRILPLGFDKSTASSDIKVAGNALNDDNFIGGSDTITYKVSNLSDASYSVSIELLYQTIGFNFASDLFSDASTEVSNFKTMYENSSLKTSQIASASTYLSQTASDASQGSSESSETSEPVVTPEPVYECNDGIDNDGDGAIDMSDSGCSNSTDNQEYKKGNGKGRGGR